MLELGRGAVSKMQIALDAPAQYSFRLDDELHEFNQLIGANPTFGVFRPDQLHPL